MTTREPAQSAPMTPEQAATLLDVALDADETTVRAAYLRGVRAHAPDVDPDGFERVREAYELLRDPLARARRMLEVDPDAPLTSLVEPSSWHFVGPGPWVAAIRQEMRTCHASD